MKQISQSWAQQMQERIDQNLPIDCTTAQNIVAQWLIRHLALGKRNFKLYQLGAGVKRITTDTDTCPCCKRPLK